MDILVVGTGYVGLVTGICFAEMGHSVTCLDIDKEKIALLRRGEIPFFEPGLRELLLSNQKQQRLFFTTDYAVGMERAEACLIAVGTPSLADGSADLSQIEQAATTITDQIKRHTTIIIKSTVPVGTTRDLKRRMRAALDARNPALSFDIIASPEFLKEGSAIEDCMKPDRIIIGSDNERATNVARMLYSPFTLSRDRILIMNFESAELSKYASNAMLALRVSFMNELSSLAEAVGANIHEVRQGISSDQRIGYQFLYAGAGYGGSCFPKDLRALKATATANDCSSLIVTAIEKVNENQKRVLANKITAYFATQGGVQGKTIAVWGLSYKPNTDDVREAPALTLIRKLHDQGATLRLYDPIASDNAKKALGPLPRVSFCTSEYHAAQNADAIALVTEWKQFRFVNFSSLITAMRGTAFFDGRNQYKAQEMAAKGFDYFGIGMLPTPTDLLRKLRCLHQKQAHSYASTSVCNPHPLFD
ncbi:MAG: UDP-glucose/GDP-mannose dehydrogenase family protein [Chlamydiota bacterium]